MLMVVLTGCAVTNQQRADAAMHAKSKADYLVHCYMGQVQSVTVLTDGPGRFEVELEKDECDGNDRT